jgi:hypothetical protein
MPIKLVNNASGTIATTINASDTGIALTTGDGAKFPALGASDYFYATITSTAGTQEIVKVTVRSGDSLTVVRAQENTTAASFAAGSRFELRVTVQSVEDLIDDYDDALRADLVASTGSSLVGFLQAGSGAAARLVQSKLRDSVDVKDFGAVGDGVADDTAAFNAAMAYAYSTGIGVVEANGDFKTGNLTFPTLITLRFAGTWRPTTTINITNGVTLIGAGLGGSQFSTDGTNCLTVVPHGLTTPVLKITCSAGTHVENIKMLNPVGLGIQVGDNALLGALLRLKNVHVNCFNAVATSAPINVDNFFWLWIDSCSFMTNTGTAQYSMRLNCDASATAYTGLVFVRDTVFNGYGVIIRGYGICGTMNFVDCSVENSLSDFFTIDAADSSKISGLLFDRTYMFDNLGGHKFFNITTSPITAVTWRGDTNYLSFTASSKSIFDLNVEGTRLTKYTAALSIKNGIDTKYTRNFGDGNIDARAIPTDHNFAPSLVPYTPFAVTSMSTWTPAAGQTLTGGFRAPDGTLNAYELAGADGGFVGYAAAGLTPAAGDWVIAGIWTQETSGTKQPQVPVVDFAVAAGTFTFTETGNSLLYIRNNENASIGDTSWKLKVVGDKVATAVGATVVPRFGLTINSTLYGVTRYFSPFMIRIPAGTATDDAIISWIRSLKAVPPSAEAGDIAVLDHQKIRLGGGVRMISLSAAPTTGTWKRGDVVWNTTPSAGGTPGWVCVTAGTPGTWKAMANLAA